MTLRHFPKANCFVTLMILLGIIVVLALSAFFLAYSVPGILAAPPPQFETREIYTFEPWAFAINEMEVSFPEGGAIIPLYIEGKQFGALWLGFGRYREPGRTGKPDHNPTGFFATLTEKEMEEKQGNVIFMPMEEPEKRRHALQTLEGQVVLPVLWERFIPLTFQPGPEAAYYYFLDESGAPLLPPTLSGRPSDHYLAALLYLLFMAIIVLILIIFVPDHRYSAHTKQLLQTPPRRAGLIALLPVLFLVLGGELLPLTGKTPGAAAGAGCWAAMIFLVILARSGRIDHLDFGLHRETALRGYGMAAAAAAMLIVVTSGVPKRIVFTGWGTLTDLIRLFILVALAREAIWRGYIQVTLSRRFGTAAGLGLTVILAVAAHLGLLFLTSPWKLAYPYSLVEMAALVPGLALVLGIVYLRTENVVACAFLHALVLFLPQILAP